VHASPAARRGAQVVPAQYVSPVHAPVQMAQDSVESSLQ
jgi:hypothetical protein